MVRDGFVGRHDALVEQAGGRLSVAGNDLEAERVLALLEDKYDRPLAEAEYKLEAAAADPVSAQALQVPAGSPIFLPVARSSLLSARGQYEAVGFDIELPRDRQECSRPVNNLTPDHPTLLATRRHAGAEFVLKNPDAALAATRVKPLDLFVEGRIDAFLGFPPSSCRRTRLA